VNGKSDSSDDRGSTARRPTSRSSPIICHKNGLFYNMQNKC
jgi:hypothetical protein